MITVIVNVYNGEQYIERCIRSLMVQTYRELEIIIVDDGIKIVQLCWLII
ncbi:glycosyltransferase family 2 protein [Bacteroides finegoldii]|nr:glycosyltransferase family A protein [Bacteroides finegoldii]